MNPETVRKWLRQAEVEAGQVDGTTTAAAREIRELKRKNAELEQTVAILKAATSFNACGESARNTDHLYSRRRASCSGRGRADLPRAESAWLPDRPENLLCMGPPGAVATRPVGHRPEILAGYYEPDELVLAPLSGSCSPLCSRL